ncbi:MAG: ChbG/HpnK family deacetylase [Acidobacteria bacterium]|nr:ChbG/HpnK family deacetylase [Acidobacteriota bacterium]
MKKLIVNADDFGFTAGVNTGIVRAFERGIVTSATIMANGNAFEDAAERARANPGLAVGGHLSILGGRPVAPPREVASLINENGRMPGTLLELISRLACGVVRTGDIEREFRAQLGRIVGAGIHLTHVDTHKHAHMHPRVMEALLRVAGEIGVRCVRNPFETVHWPRLWGPSARVRWREYLTQYVLSMGMSMRARRFQRLARRHAFEMPDYFCGMSLTGLLDGAAIRGVVESLREGTTELVCHPGVYDEELENSPTRLKRERQCELDALTDSALLRCLREREIILISYRELA